MPAATDMGADAARAGAPVVADARLELVLRPCRRGRRSDRTICE